MTSITQQIPNYVGGVSQQPDELKVPGQLRQAKNVIPDVTHGLLKRPGGKLIGNDLSAYTTDSKWFHYYRDEYEQYIGQIQLSTGEIKMWKCDTGASCTVNYESGQTTALKNYLKQTNSGGTITDADIQTLTLNDYTYITNRNKTVAMATTKEPERPPEAFLELKKVAYANQYSVNLFDNTTLTTTTTATRIEIERTVDSRNSCLSTGVFPTWGTAPGTPSYTHVCDNPQSGGDGLNDDDMSPNVATRIFAITHGTAVDSADINGVTGVTSVVTTSSGSTGTDRKNLYFRITTTGQSTPEGSSQTPIYRTR